jgi:membrane protein required for beta-lactamase induction
MKLIIIVIAFFAEQHLGALERWRHWRWLHALADRLHGTFGAKGWWAGMPGVVLTLAGPLLLAGVALQFARDHLWVLWFVLQLAALLYAMGPYDLFNLVDRYLKALGQGDAAETERLASILAHQPSPPPEQRPQAVMEGIFVGANRRLFALYFWFVLLGAVGALLVRGLGELRGVSTSRTLGFSHAAERIYGWMMWPPTRLFALGFALAGSLTHTFDRWSFAQTRHADENDNLVKAAGLGALQFDRAGQSLGVDDERSWVEQARGLVARTFLVWLSVLGLVSLRGWLG